jgi:hypothetical protein
MTQAAVMGAMDFRDADVLDRHWWTRLSLVLNYLEGMNQVKLLEYRRDQLQLAIQVAGAPEERQFLVRSLQDTYNQLLHEMAADSRRRQTSVHSQKAYAHSQRVYASLPTSHGVAPPMRCSPS